MKTNIRTTSGSRITVYIRVSVYIPTTFFLLSLLFPSNQLSLDLISQQESSILTIDMSRAKKFAGPLVSPIALKFDAIDTNQASPFLRLSPEIRNLIYEMVLAPKNPPIISSARPFNIERKLSLALLSTCRKIYLETHLYPLQTNTHLHTLFPCRRNHSALIQMHAQHPFSRLASWQKSDR